jgi:hypothetical protein
MSLIPDDLHAKAINPPPPSASVKSGNERVFPKAFTMTDINNIPEITTPADEPSRKPISEAKLRANRENGAKSNGPVTAAGKRRSSLNAYRSGIHGQIVCATTEELEVFQKHTSDVLAEYEPSGPTENFFVSSISDNMWRIARIRALEAGIFANGFREHIDSMDAGHPEVDAALVAAGTWSRQAKELMLLSVYEGRLTRIMEKQRAELKAMQSERKEAREKAANQAALLVEHAEGKGEEYDPGEDFQPASAHGGFAFSQKEIDRRRERAAHVRAARIYRSEGKLPKRAPKMDDKAPLRAA